MRRDTARYPHRPVGKGSNTMKTVLAVRHVPFEDLGAFAPALHRAGLAVRYVEAGGPELARADPVADDLVILLGGPIGAYEETRYPFLRDELALAERRLAAGRPLMGICLGAQIIARAAGARVYPGAAGKEIGFAPVTLTAAGQASYLAPFAADGTALHWHGDTFDLPAGAERLASTPLYENQAFALGSAVAFQFHPEAGGPLEPWLIGHACELAAAGIDVAALRAQAARLGPALARKADAVMAAFLAGLGAGAPVSRPAPR